MKFAQTREDLLLSLIHREQPRAYNKNAGECDYSQKINGGCAIGCQIKEKLSYELEGGIFIDDEDDSLDSVFNMLPKRMRDLGSKFLHYIQCIHDESNSWNDASTGEKGSDGLVWNQKGKDRINKLIKDFSLNLKAI